MARFHWRNGIYFDRKADGSVEIYQEREDVSTKTSTRLDKVPFATVPPAEWASIVASVSKDGENGDTFREAHKFHTGVELDWKPVAPKPEPAKEPVPAAAAPAPAAPKKPAKSKPKAQ